jgi:hypothetical protein
LIFFGGRRKRRNVCAPSKQQKKQGKQTGKVVKIRDIDWVENNAGTLLFNVEASFLSADDFVLQIWRRRRLVYEFRQSQSEITVAPDGTVSVIIPADTLQITDGALFGYQLLAVTGQGSYVVYDGRFTIGNGGANNTQVSFGAGSAAGNLGVITNPIIAAGTTFSVPSGTMTFSGAGLTNAGTVVVSSTPEVVTGGAAGFTLGTLGTLRPLSVLHVSGLIANLKNGLIINNGLVIANP